jgi:hypothetical protein
MAEEELEGAQVAGAAAAHPGRQPSVLPGGHAMLSSPARKEELAGPFAGGSEVRKQPREYARNLKADGPASLPLAHQRTRRCDALRRDILDRERQDIAAAQLAVDREIEEGEVARSAIGLQLRADRPDMTCLGRSGGFAPMRLPLCRQRFRLSASKACCMVILPRSEATSMQ